MRHLWIAAALLATSTYISSAQTPAEALDQAFAHYTLLKEGTRPWHLIASVQLYDSKGNASESGTVEEFFRDPEHLRVDYKFPSVQRTEYIEGNDRYVAGAGSTPPMAVTELMHHLLRPRPVDSSFNGTTVSAANRKFGTTALKCLTVEGSIKQILIPPITGIYPEFCVSEPDNHLRISILTGGNSTVLNQIGNFLGNDVPMQIALRSYEGKLLGELKVTGLKTFDPAANPDLFKVPENVAHSYANATKVSGGVMAGKIIKKVTPTYPPGARMDHISGAVILAVRIGVDGTIQELQVVSAPRADLALSALLAVRQWTYTPYKIGDVPTDVDSTITVNFNIGY